MKYKSSHIQWGIHVINYADISLGDGGGVGVRVGVVVFK